MIAPLGIMQGRLAPPLNNRIQAFPVGMWEEEFPRCQELGLTCLEWVFERPGLEENPLFSEAGVERMRQMQQRYGVRVHSVVADYFMDVRLFGPDADEVGHALGVLDRLLTLCALAGIPLIELPFVDGAAILETASQEQVLRNLRRPLARAADLGVTLSLETSLDPRTFLGMIEAADDNRLKVNFDMGNSAAMGFDPTEEIALLGPHIVNVHIKDRVTGGGTVPLGQGNTRFAEVFAALERVHYAGDFILQAARKDVGVNPSMESFMETVRTHIAFVTPYMQPFARRSR